MDKSIFKYSLLVSLTILTACKEVNKADGPKKTDKVDLVDVCEGCVQPVLSPLLLPLLPFSIGRKTTSKMQQTDRSLHAQESNAVVFFDVLLLFDDIVFF